MAMRAVRTKRKIVKRGREGRREKRRRSRRRKRRSASRRRRSCVVEKRAVMVLAVVIAVTVTMTMVVKIVKGTTRHVNAAAVIVVMMEKAVATGSEALIRGPDHSWWLHRQNETSDHDHDRLRELVVAQKAQDARHRCRRAVKESREDPVRGRVDEAGATIVTAVDAQIHRPHETATNVRALATAETDLDLAIAAEVRRIQRIDIVALSRHRDELGVREVRLHVAREAALWTQTPWTALPRSSCSLEMMIDSECSIFSITIAPMSSRYPHTAISHFLSLLIHQMPLLPTPRHQPCSSGWNCSVSEMPMSTMCGMPFAMRLPTTARYGR